MTRPKYCSLVPDINPGNLPGLGLVCTPERFSFRGSARGFGLYRLGAGSLN